MSMTIPSQGASAIVPPSAGTARKGSSDPSGPGSFGEALSRATKPDRGTTAKSAEKTAPSTPGRRHGGGAKTETDEQVEPINLLGHVPLENRARPGLLAGGANPDTPATRAACAGQAAAGALLQAQADVLPADALMALPDAVIDAKPATGLVLADAATDAGPATGLVLADAGPRERGQANALAKGLTPGHPATVPAAVPVAQSSTAPSTARDGPAFMPALTTDRERLDTEGPQDGNGPQAPAAEPAASPAMIKQALQTPASDAETSNTTAATPPPLTPAPGDEASAFTGLAVTGAPAQGTVIPPRPDLPAPLTTLSVRPEVGSSEWGQALSQQLVHLGRAGHETAELQLNPPGLGPLKVSLSMNDHQIQAAFVSAHSSVRAAVEAALPQLRATLADNGISLGDASVSSDSRQQADLDQGQRQGERPGHRNEASAGLRALAPIAGRSLLEPRRQGGGASVDTYA